MPKEVYNHMCLAVIMMDFVYEKYGNYYSQVFKRNSKYIENK